MDGPRDYHTKSVRERQISWYHFYEESKKQKIQMKLFTKQKQTHRFRGWIYAYGGGEG